MINSLCWVFSHLQFLVLLLQVFQNHLQLFLILALTFTVWRIFLRLTATLLPTEGHNAGLQLRSLLHVLYHNTMYVSVFSHLCMSAISARSLSISSFSVAICRRSTCSREISSSCSVRISFSWLLRGKHTSQVGIHVVNVTYQERTFCVFEWLTCAKRRLMTSSSFSVISSFDTSSFERLAISWAILLSHS